MSTPRDNIKSIFQQALDIPDPAARAAFLDGACGSDTTLRAEVESLIAANDEAGGFLNDDLNPDVRTSAFIAAETASVHGTEKDTTAAITHISAPAPDETISYQGRGESLGVTIDGKYKLIEEIGEGGMGTVFLAQQTEPVKRLVAVKVIKPGMDSKTVLARFEAERQALAIMDHPNIARVLDAGTTEEGRPFFVMELVKGVPLTHYYDHHRLSVNARLELFVSICQAVQHAHQKGIIHRDLKPGNVLVAEVDGKPIPKVIDFGVAKATELKLTDQSFDDAGAIVGTPAYMSPEQADPSTIDIDTRTDVYALGVMLYELWAFTRICG
jgi:serine/threonine protein kinase